MEHILQYIQIHDTNEVNMNEVKTDMIAEATSDYSIIFPCGNKTSFEDCFTRNGDQLIFWFNTEDHSTHVISKTLS
jgi:hypothetical protein